jgi:hypothetical protein
LFIDRAVWQTTLSVFFSTFSVVSREIFLLQVSSHHLEHRPDCYLVEY